MKRNIIVILSIYLISLPCQAQTNNREFFSLDLSYSLTSILNYGLGIGINYERSLLDYLSISGLDKLYIGDVLVKIGLKEWQNLRYSYGTPEVHERFIKKI